MNIKAIFSDLDGTLLDDKKMLPQTNIDALFDASKKGIKIIIATGRNYSGISDITSKLPMVDYAITSNGAAIYSVRDDEVIYRDYMDNSVVLDLTSVLDIDNIMFDLFIDGKAYMEEKNIEFLKKLDVSEEVKKFISNNRTIIPSVKKYLLETKTAVEKITINFLPLSDGTFFLRNETIDIINSSGILSCVSGGSNNVEVTMKSATKGNAIRHICKLLNVSLANTISYGDSENDLHMLKTTGISVAMQNSPEIVRNTATYITSDNNNGGVSESLKQLNII